MLQLHVVVAYSRHCHMVLSFLQSKSFKRQFHKMVKHTQTIRLQFLDELFECVWPFCGIGA